MTLPLTAAPGQTNGVIELTYDPALLTLERIQGPGQRWSAISTMTAA